MCPAVSFINALQRAPIGSSLPLRDFPLDVAGSNPVARS
jgi:hypothetical protein